jgi:hypothetical protein
MSIQTATLIPSRFGEPAAKRKKQEEKNYTAQEWKDWFDEMQQREDVVRRFWWKDDQEWASYPGNPEEKNPQSHLSPVGPEPTLPLRSAKTTQIS